ncbi:hypothetical protein TPA0907_10570 [Micromonospora humidisoli]|uniref:hypothetical protein n=1 Tax=Micromonospora sp. AKA109 TaxID=2733865 RepID=UPI0022C7A97C|nr:hypothetical protein [Micromonospora sp. AKA109]GHJ06690.1 hypothetical protein TPA0907_10570 [Micromonospora sp. AKA109]
MAGYDEYAAAVRQLSARIREGERGAVAEAERRRALHAGVTQLGQRLAAQEQRLAQLAAAAGLPAVADPAPGTGSVPGVDTAPGAAPGSAVPPGSAVSPGSATGTGAVAGTGVDGDPAVVLAEAARLVDEVDRLGQQAEALAQRPVLLATWSPTARAVAVYVGCAAVGVLAMLVLLVANGIGAVGDVTAATLNCAGLPLISFVAGWLILGRWGRPALADTDPPRYAPLGFVICALLVPLSYCVTLLLFRFSR